MPTSPSTGPRRAAVTACCFFAPEMDETVRDRRHLAQELKHAIQNDKLQVFYQPQRAIGSDETVGYEALVRWPHPERGYVPPDVFVRIAEESDLILALGEWVIRTVCREAALWAEPYKVAVNLSAVQLRQGICPKSCSRSCWRRGCRRAGSNSRSPRRP